MLKYRAGPFLLLQHTNMTTSAASKALCPCGSGKPYAQCCEPLHTFKEKAKTVKQLVRARYCAYALGAGRHREFLIRTWHPASAKSINIVDITNDSYEWCGLEILFADQKGDLGRVEFKASFREQPDGPVQIHHEQSIFHRIKGNWHYLEGRVREETAPEK
jgi:SEC-C motif-containing protein